MFQQLATWVTVASALAVGLTPVAPAAVAADTLPLVRDAAVRTSWA